MFEDGEKFERLNIWKLIPKPKDTRPRWRVEFDNGSVAFGKDFQVRSRADSLSFGVAASDKEPRTPLCPPTIFARARLRPAGWR